MVHVRAAPFETTSSVNGRRVSPQHGSADVTVLPGVVQVKLAAFPPAGSTSAIVAATDDGTVVRFPATLDAQIEHQLHHKILEATATQHPGTAFKYGGQPDLDVRLSDDASRVTFSGSSCGRHRGRRHGCGADSCPRPAGVRGSYLCRRAVHGHEATDMVIHPATHQTDASESCGTKKCCEALVMELV